jgi:hypothetical protein
LSPRAREGIASGLIARNSLANAFALKKGFFAILKLDGMRRQVGNSSNTFLFNEDWSDFLGAGRTHWWHLRRRGQIFEKLRPLDDDSAHALHQFGLSQGLCGETEPKLLFFWL